jgi:hypothetical protein
MNTASTKPTKHTKDKDKAEDKTLVYIKEIVIRIYTIKNIHTKKNTKEAKKIKDFNKRNATFVTNKTASQQSTLPKNVREHIKGFVNKLYTQQSKMLSSKSTAAFLSNTKDLKELTTLLLSPNLI